MYNGDLFLLSGFLHLVFSVLVIVFIIWLVMWVLRGGHGRRHFRRGFMRSPGLDILDERYAKGEITKEDYETRKKDLLSDSY